MHEELIGYWSHSTVVADVRHGERRMTVLRVPSEMEREVHGMAQCSVTRDGKLEGVFWLRWSAENKTVGGYLCPNLDDMYGFPVRPVPETTDWPELLAFVKNAVDFNYQFPSELGVTHQFTGLSAKINRWKM